MRFEWDDAKREINLGNHGIDFVRAITIWRGVVVDPAATRSVGGELRHLALGTIGDDQLTIAVVYTFRNGARRIISARRARRNERGYYKDRAGFGT